MRSRPAIIISAALMMIAACATSKPSTALSPDATAKPPTTTSPTTDTSTPTPDATAKTRKSATPTIDTGIEVYGNCTKPSVEPVEIVLTCADYGEVLQGLHWMSWTSSSATAVGTLKYNDCTPDCASGHFHYVPGTRVILTDPVRGAGGQLVWSRVQEAPQPPGYETGPYHGGPQPLPTQPG